MTVYDLAGRVVWRDEAVTLAAGRHHLEWNGRESAGPCAPGMYLARIEVGGRAWVRRVALMR